jgi:disulfide bond formation protein DsbB
LDGSGNDVAFAGGAVAASKSDTYTVKLVTYLKVTNTYEGKPVDALVTVRDAKTGLILHQRRGGEVTFELEPQVSYIVESTTDSETQTARTTLPQDTAISFTFTKPPAVSINWEMVQTIAVIVAVIAIIALVIIIAKRGVSIEIG